jgi:hypothetical protein
MIGRQYGLVVRDSMTICLGCDGHIDTLAHTSHVAGGGCTGWKYGGGEQYLYLQDRE